MTIQATFGSAITGASNATQIENTINSALGFYDNTITNNIRVKIAFDGGLSGTDLGKSNTGAYSVSYSGYYNDLSQSSTSATDATALANLSSIDPFGSGGTVAVNPANALALGIVPHIKGSAGSVNLNLDALNFPGNSGSYDATTAIQHEVDEVLGLGSIMAPGVSTPSGVVRPEDLFRYDAHGNRSLTKSSTASAYFSLNGTTDLAQFNQTGTGDYGDWLTNCGDPRVQDAGVCANTQVSLNRSSVEATALDAIGYTLTPVPLPASGALMFSGLVGLLGWRGRRRRAA